MPGGEGLLEPGEVMVYGSVILPIPEWQLLQVEMVPTATVQAGVVV